MSAQKLQGKVAVVTGGARGIGAAIAARLAADGAAVVVNYAKSAKEAEAVAEAIRKAGGRASAHKADMSDPAQAKALVEAAFKEFGRLDILVNNAGRADFAPLQAVDGGHVKGQFDLNVNGPIFATQAAAVRFPKEGGRVINVSSVVATGAFPGASVYAATKAALEALTRVWAAELGPQGVTVNAVAPGPVETDMLNSVMSREMKDARAAVTPLGRLGAPADIADAVAFLASNDSRWVTGQTIQTAGGMRA
ncbi:MAG: glucose 1-dehydrogenase [Elusimicrobia bacterium]|nr:glucose 1-dehydrogenase [Elusimicrobiota bacterium]